jgi:hypothetical protein
MKNYLYLSALVAFILSSSFSCIRRAPDNLSIDEDRLRSVIKEKKITVLCFWTSFKGVSKNIATETYTALGDSINANKYNANVILLNGSGGADSLIKSLNRPGVQSYYTQFIGDEKGSMDYEAIKGFVKDLFPDYKWKQLAKEHFGIPITLIVDQKLKVINEMAPQDIKGLLTIVKQ